MVTGDAEMLLGLLIFHGGSVTIQKKKSMVKKYETIIYIW